MWPPFSSQSECDPELVDTRSTDAPLLWITAGLETVAAPAGTRGDRGRTRRLHAREPGDEITRRRIGAGTRRIYCGVYAAEADRWSAGLDRIPLMWGFPGDRDRALVSVPFHSLPSLVNAEFPEDVMHVILDRGLLDAQALSDLFVG